MKKYLFLIFISLLSFSCSKEKPYRIAVSQPSQDDWRAKMNAEILREIILHDDVEVEIRSADDSNEKQIADIRDFAARGFDIIIVSPNEAAALTPVIDEVYASGIPVIIFDRNILSESYTARFGADDEGLGRSAADFASHILPRGAKAIEIYGRIGSTPAEGRHDGFAGAFSKAGGNLLASATGNWNKDEAARVADSLLKIYPDVDLIYAHNDRMAIGASEVARRMGLDSVRVIGIDAAPGIGINAVADGTLDATFLYPTEGDIIVRTALAILKGEPYDRETVFPLSSAVDRTNADILLRQNEALARETEKMSRLKSKIDVYWARYSTQTTLFYSSIVIILLLIAVTFLLLKAFWQRDKHRKELLARNVLLQEERDKQEMLNRQLEEATQSKLIFFTNVSHDLRTPLTLIAEPVSRLCAASNLTPTQERLVRIADKNVKILRRLINQILDFRKYENGKLELNIAEVDFSRAVEDWVESFVATARAKDISLNLEGPGQPVVQALDAEKIERVFFNLLSNAIKYTPRNGAITIRYGVDGDVLRFSVIDTGEGISERDIPNIFDRFYQVDRLHPKGSGIGLSLAKAFVELHGGEIKVESTPGKGSVFTVEIPIRHVGDCSAPLVPEAQITSDEIESELGSISGEGVFNQEKPLLLVIDDNADIRSLITDIMSDDYNVILASNGMEGVGMAVKYVPDLVICDVMMPVLDGFECCRRIKSEVSTSHIPVVLLTACSLDEQRVQGYESGADGYVSKPFSSDVLKARCASMLENRKRILNLVGNGDSELQASSAADPKKAVEAAGAGIEDEFYKKFLEIFYSEMASSQLSVDMLASRMGLERSQFYRKIKALTNYSPVELIRHLRLKEARKMLLTSDRTVSEVGYAVGFSTPAYFTKCYHEAFGETPSDTRERLGR
ncbi:MAG: substrate-binding domain-containing protein [Muribaculaceae bacterium]|nr:substrate-binding domain-containing protein [Muribaculaceae bacterium]